MINLYLIRHGRQCSRLCNVDVELAAEGRKQAELLRDRMKHYEIDALYSSDLIRARQTAAILNEALQLPHIIKEGIKEISFGLLEGNSDEFINEHFSEFKKQQKMLMDDIPYPEGENGRAVYQRAMPVIQEVINSGSKNVAIVTHGGTIRVLLAALVGKNQANRFLFGLSLENTSITHLQYDKELDRFYLERFNDFAHLEGHPELLRKNI